MGRPAITLLINVVNYISPENWGFHGKHLVHKQKNITEVILPGECPGGQQRQCPT
jgi:hypothetical protein